MKRLFLIWIFSGSLDGFSQEIKILDRTVYKAGDTAYTGFVMIRDVVKPDTLRATLIVYYDKGPAILHTKPGYVVKQWIGKDAVYLDDKKKVIKAPLEVFGYKLK